VKRREEKRRDQKIGDSRRKREGWTRKKNRASTCVTHMHTKGIFEKKEKMWTKGREDNEKKRGSFSHTQFDSERRRKKKKNNT